jgi:hypothetical protein
MPYHPDLLSYTDSFQSLETRWRTDEAFRRDFIRMGAREGPLFIRRTTYAQLGSAVFRVGRPILTRYPTDAGIDEVYVKRAALAALTSQERSTRLIAVGESLGTDGCWRISRLPVRPPWRFPPRVA